MIESGIGQKIAFIALSSSRVHPLSAFVEYLAEGMLPASYGFLQPVWIVIRQELLRDDADLIQFLIRHDFQSDYREAADFINAGNADAVIVHYDFSCFDSEQGACLCELLNRIDVPIILAMQMVPQNPGERDYQNLADACNAADSVVVMDKHDYELLRARFVAAHDKIEYLSLNRQDDPHGQQINWFHLGRQYWLLLERHINRHEGDLRSLRADREHSLLYGQ